MPKGLNMARTAAGPGERTYPNTVIMSMRTALDFDFTATWHIIPLLPLLCKKMATLTYNAKMTVNGTRNARRKYNVVEDCPSRF